MVEKLASSIWLLLFPQLPIEFYFGIFQDDRYIIERALFGAMIVAALFEVGITLRLLKIYTSTNKVSLFQAQQFRENRRNASQLPNAALMNESCSASIERIPLLDDIRIPK
jgi:hypothetical protein